MDSQDLPPYAGIHGLTPYEVVSYLIASHMGIEPSVRRTPTLQEFKNTLELLSTKITLGE